MKLGYLLLPLFWASAGLAAVPPGLTIDPHAQALLGSYNQAAFRQNGLTTSRVHWDQRILVYSSQDQGAYRNNCRAVQRQLAADDPAETARFAAYPSGTKLVKEGYPLQGEVVSPQALYVMVKGPKGSAPNQGDWQYLQWRQVPGQPQAVHLNPGEAGCANCHQEAAERDFVFATQCPPAPAQP